MWLETNALQCPGIESTNGPRNQSRKLNNRFCRNIKMMWRLFCLHLSQLSWGLFNFSVAVCAVLFTFSAGFVYLLSSSLCCFQLVLFTYSAADCGILFTHNLNCYVYILGMILSLFVYIFCYLFTFFCLYFFSWPLCSSCLYSSTWSSHLIWQCCCLVKWQYQGLHLLCIGCKQKIKYAVK